MGLCYAVYDDGSPLRVLILYRAYNFVLYMLFCFILVLIVLFCDKDFDDELLIVYWDTVFGSSDDALVEDVSWF